ncbi:MAG: bifunctional 3,4-dihydroxy-2-butanone-4-phosphate synthase/GTP cyclohydrolase II [Candidatus Coatesbacteria bacterium]|nr:bifunctional 3,4-dihydroxy-2-butanone-4-phosphate synthase/GTP cyclohydrolase II [Candidatus Coatesbacteria bacterium]
MDKSEKQYCGATTFDSIERAIAEIKAGKMVIVVDDEDRENEGDLTCAAEKITPEIVNFMAKYGRGLICVPLMGARLDQLGLEQMTEHNRAPLGTAFTVSVDAARGVTTGISAADRAKAIEVLADVTKGPDSIVVPGHVFPLRARPGGVLVRAGQTEAAVDLARLAGLYPAGVICEVMKDDGEMARVPDLLPFREEHGIPIVTVQDLIRYRFKREILVEQVSKARLPTKYGEFTCLTYRDILTNEHHLALVMGDLKKKDSVLVRVHSECLTGEVFKSLRCDCGDQLEKAMKIIADEGVGVLLYLRQEGRGIGLHNKLRAYELQDAGRDTVEANVELGFAPDKRDYGIGAQILRHLGVQKMRLMTNNPVKLVALKGYGLESVERIPLEIPPTEENRNYLEVKRRKMGHILTKV